MIISTSYSIRSFAAAKDLTATLVKKEKAEDAESSNVLAISGKQLKSLDVSRCHLLTHEGFFANSMSRCTGLLYLDVSFTKIKSLEPISTHCCVLQALNLAGTVHISDYVELTNITTLELLNLRHSLITDQQFQDSVSSLILLRSLDLGGTSIIDLTGLTALTRLEELILDECNSEVLPRQAEEREAVRTLLVQEARAKQRARAIVDEEASEKEKRRRRKAAKRRAMGQGEGEEEGEEEGEGDDFSGQVTDKEDGDDGNDEVEAYEDMSGSSATLASSELIDEDHEHELEGEEGSLGSAPQAVVASTRPITAGALGLGPSLTAADIEAQKQLYESTQQASIVANLQSISTLCFRRYANLRLIGIGGTDLADVWYDQLMTVITEDLVVQTLTQRYARERY